MPGVGLSICVLTSFPGYSDAGFIQLRHLYLSNYYVPDTMSRLYIIIFSITTTSPTTAVNIYNILYAKHFVILI